MYLVVPQPNFTRGLELVELMNTVGADFRAWNDRDMLFGAASALQLLSGSSFPWLGGNLVGPDGSLLGENTPKGNGTEWGQQTLRALGFQYAKPHQAPQGPYNA